MNQEVLRADLRRVRLASLLQLAEAEMFRGRLVLQGGEVSFAEGEIVDARCGALTAVDALRELFVAEGGEARLVTAEVSGPRLGPTLALVMEGCRVADEWDRVRSMVLVEVAPADLPGEVLRRLDGRGTLGEVVRAAGVPVVAVLDRVLRLLDEGALAEAAPRRPEAPPVPPAPGGDPDRYSAALEEGRNRLRAGELALAERAFRAALAERPGDRIANQNLRRLQILQAAEAPR